MNSNAKGKRGEREAAKALAAALGCTARRGQQFSGSEDSPDVVHTIPGVHVEVKRTERLRLYESVQQASDDAGESVPVVLHRKNNEEWLVVVPLAELRRLAEAIRDFHHATDGTSTSSAPPR